MSMKDKILQSRLKKIMLAKKSYPPQQESEQYKAAKLKFRMFQQAKLSNTRANSCEK